MITENIIITTCQAYFQDYLNLNVEFKKDDYLKNLKKKDGLVQ